MKLIIAEKPIEFYVYKVINGIIENDTDLTISCQNERDVLIKTKILMNLYLGALGFKETDMKKDEFTSQGIKKECYIYSVSLKDKNKKELIEFLNQKETKQIQEFNEKSSKEGAMIYIWKFLLGRLNDLRKQENEDYNRVIKRLIDGTE